MHHLAISHNFALYHLEMIFAVIKRKGHRILLLSLTSLKVFDMFIYSPRWSTIHSVKESSIQCVKYNMSPNL